FAESRSNKENIVPVLWRLFAGVQKEFKIFGSDYDTEDGTPSRDYIHIQDLIEGHCAAAEYLLSDRYNPKHMSINLGTGRSVTVLQLLKCVNEFCDTD